MTPNTQPDNPSATLATDILAIDHAGDGDNGIAQSPAQKASGYG